MGGGELRPFLADLDGLRDHMMEPGAEPEWLPIHTAPKDGTKFKAQDRTNYGLRVFRDTHWYTHPSVQDWITDVIDCGDYLFEPTHWQKAAPTPTPAGPDYAAHGKEMEEALRAADQFITNGVELGYIRLPDAWSNDPAVKTLGMVRAILSKLKGEA